ncbi:hypothetical protein V0M98_33360 (plasmid) [Pseudomonas silesiensis]|uniref:hypothetical protein n=1 Tax=Pseudomonas silesiensis TaxID=1853130 RepID=UPI0030D24E04
MPLDINEKFNRELAKLRTCAGVIEIWPGRKIDSKSYKNYGQMLNLLSHHLETVQLIVKEEQERLFAAIAQRPDQSDDEVKSAPVISFCEARDRRAALNLAP